MRDYSVGRGKPPVHTRFKKGQVANPNGRRGKIGGSKKSPTKELAEIFSELLNEKVTVNSGSGKESLSRWEICIRQLLMSAMKGHPSAMRELRAWRGLMPEIFRPQPHVTSIELELFSVNPFMDGLASLERFLEAFPNAPEDDLAVLRKYLR